MIYYIDPSEGEDLARLVARAVRSALAAEQIDSVLYDAALMADYVYALEQDRLCVERELAFHTYLVKTGQV